VALAENARQEAPEILEDGDAEKSKFIAGADSDNPDLILMVKEEREVATGDYSRPRARFVPNRVAGGFYLSARNAIAVLLFNKDHTVFVQKKVCGQHEVRTDSGRSDSGESEPPNFDAKLKGKPRQRVNPIPVDKI
jgi:hypothetical protein